MPDKTSTLSFAIIALLLVVLKPHSAFALGLPNAQCTDPSNIVATPVVATLPEMSRLENMRMQQKTGLTLARPEVRPAGKTEPKPMPPCLRGTADSTIAELTKLPTPPIWGYYAITYPPNIFGSVAVRVSRTPLDAKWHSVSSAKLSAHSGAWATLIHIVAREHDPAKKLHLVNLWVNGRVRSAGDRPDPGGDDHWAGANETLRSGGDCEDYAIAKMQVLEAAGFARADMYLVIARDLVRRADHALLVVRLDHWLLVLDSNTDQLLDADSVSDYRPIFTYGAQGAWIHGYAEKPTLPRYTVQVVAEEGLEPPTPGL